MRAPPPGLWTTTTPPISPSRHGNAPLRQMPSAPNPLHERNLYRDIVARGPEGPGRRVHPCVQDADRALPQHRHPFATTRKGYAKRVEESSSATDHGFSKNGPLAAAVRMPSRPDTRTNRPIPL